MGPIEHDLPEYQRNDSPPPLRWRAQIFGTQLGWSWTHQCLPRYYSERYGYTTWAEAFRSACEHMRGCP